MRTFGIEEEFFIIEPLTGLPCAPRCTSPGPTSGTHGGRHHHRRRIPRMPGRKQQPHLHRSRRGMAEMRSYRSALSRATRDLGYRVVALGTPPLIPEAPAIVSTGDRYRCDHLTVRGDRHRTLPLGPAHPRRRRRSGMRHHRPERAAPLAPGADRLRIQLPLLARKRHRLRVLAKHPLPALGHPGHSTPFPGRSGLRPWHEVHARLRRGAGSRAHQLGRQALHPLPHRRGTGRPIPR